MLAVTAIFTHLAAALRFRGIDPKLCWLIATFGFIFGAYTVAVYSAVFFEIELPQAYQDYIDNLF